MKKLILLVSVAAFAIGAPAVAQHGNGHSKQAKSQSAKSNGKAHAKLGGNHLVTAPNGGRLYALNARGACPPGLAKKNNGCMPPGQAKNWSRGQPLGSGVGFVPLPADLLAQITTPVGYQFVRVLNDVLLIAHGSRTVVDAVADMR